MENATKDARDAVDVEPIELEGRNAVGYVIPLGPANLVLVRTAAGVLGCGSIDPAPLQRLGLAAARVRPTNGPSVANVQDLLAGEVREANDLARASGVQVGMSGADALRRL